MTRFAQGYYIQPMAFVIAVMVMIFSRLIITARRAANQLGRVWQFTGLDSLMHYCSGLMLVIVVSEVFTLASLVNLLALWGLGIFFGILEALLSKIGVAVVSLPVVLCAARSNLWQLAALICLLIVPLANVWITAVLVGYLVSANFAVGVMSVFSIPGFMELIKRLNLLTAWAKFHFTSKIKTPRRLGGPVSKRRPIAFEGQWIIANMWLNKKSANWLKPLRRSNYTIFAQAGQL